MSKARTGGVCAGALLGALAWTSACGGDDSSSAVDASSDGTTESGPSDGGGDATSDGGADGATSFPDGSILSTPAPLPSDDLPIGVLAQPDGKYIAVAGRVGGGHRPGGSHLPRRIGDALADRRRLRARARPVDATWCRSARARRSPRYADSMGRRTVTVVPFPSSLAKSIVPLCCCTSS